MGMLSVFSPRQVLDDTRVCVCVRVRVCWAMQVNLYLHAEEATGHCKSDINVLDDTS